jgi:hypothetical protein
MKKPKNKSSFCNNNLLIQRGFGISSLGIVDKLYRLSLVSPQLWKILKVPAQTQTTPLRMAMPLVLLLVVARLIRSVERFLSAAQAPKTTSGGIRLLVRAATATAIGIITPLRL